MKIMSIVNKAKKNKGQALTEFVFIIPVLFIIFFVLVQFANILDYRQKSRMSLWCGLRASSIPDQKFVGVSVLSPQYKTNDIIGWMKRDVFSSKDIVNISIDRGQTPVILNTVDVKIDAYVPYLYEGVTWKGLQDVFEGRTVTKDGKKYFLIKHKGKMYLFTPVAPPV